MVLLKYIFFQMRRFSSVHTMDPTILQSKFRGALLGTLLGDCCGAPYEGDLMESPGDKNTLRKYFDKLEGPFFKAPVKQYTDDTAMTKCVTSCLIEHKTIDPKALATSFIKEYFKQPNRGYGQSVGPLFLSLKKTNLADPFGPAKELFGGLGSYGNGASMRVAPVGLFCHNKPEKLVELTENSAKISHASKEGINGAILQAAAVNLCVNRQPNNFNREEFLDKLLEQMQKSEIDDDELSIEKGTPYQTQLLHVRRMLDAKVAPSDEEVLNVLGHSVRALYSVPTAIFCFLRALNDIENIKTENPFRRALEYAISLGGDTDTIASMAGALSGALHGDTIIPENLMKHCEDHSVIIELANKLYDASV